MTSTMRFDKWENSLGQPYGAVLQVVHAKAAGPVSNASGYFSTTSTSRVSTGLTVSITPKFANSKLLVKMIVQYNQSGSASKGAVFWVYRDGVNTTSGGNENAAMFYYEGDSNDMYGTGAADIWVNANSTNTTTFSLDCKVWNSGTLRISGHDGQTSLTVFEIAQ